MTLYLIRHADAGKRDPYSPGDHLRGLSEDGQRQARRIADRLGDAGVTRVFSSPYPRCVETVEPLARRLGLEVEPEPLLAEGANGLRTYALMTDLAGADAVLCSHGDVIPEVIRMLRITGTVIGNQRGNAKGSVWTITTDGKSFLTAEYAKTPRKPGAVLR
ncbi:MAG: histidine phosphatase family protein [Acidimicrobiia bacterium]|nr:histidine phosphatase family protein [Acidimicrobiia bacterium]